MCITSLHLQAVLGILWHLVHLEPSLPVISPCRRCLGLDNLPPFLAAPPPELLLESLGLDILDALHLVGLFLFLCHLAVAILIRPRQVDARLDGLVVLCAGFLEPLGELPGRLVVPALALLFPVLGVVPVHVPDRALDQGERRLGALPHLCAFVEEVEDHVGQLEEAEVVCERQEKEGRSGRERGGGRLGRRGGGGGPGGLSRLAKDAVGRQRLPDLLLPLPLVDAPPPAPPQPLQILLQARPPHHHHPALHRPPLRLRRVQHARQRERRRRAREPECLPALQQDGRVQLARYRAVQRHRRQRVVDARSDEVWLRENAQLCPLSDKAITKLTLTYLRKYLPARSASSSPPHLPAQTTTRLGSPRLPPGIGSRPYFSTRSTTSCLIRLHSERS